MTHPGIDTFEELLARIDADPLARRRRRRVRILRSVTAKGTVRGPLLVLDADVLFPIRIGDFILPASTGASWLVDHRVVISTVDSSERRTS